MILKILAVYFALVQWPMVPLPPQQRMLYVCVEMGPAFCFEEPYRIGDLECA